MDKYANEENVIYECEEKKEENILKNEERKDYYGDKEDSSFCNSDKEEDNNKKMKLKNSIQIIKEENKIIQNIKKPKIIILN